MLDYGGGHGFSFALSYQVGRTDLALQLRKLSDHQGDEVTLAVLGTRDGGGKLIVASTEGSIVAKKHDANEILAAIAGHIDGGGGGRPTMAQGGGSNPDGIPAALDAARDLLGL